MVKNERNKGITLIALIVTIVVLLILAGVTINAITGSESAMEKATEAREKNEQGTELEDVKVSVVNAIANGLTGLVEDGALRDALQGKNYSLTNNNDGTWTITGQKASYIVSTNGEVTQVEGLSISGSLTIVEGTVQEITVQKYGEAAGKEVSWSKDGNVIFVTSLTDETEVASPTGDTVYVKVGVYSSTDTTTKSGTITVSATGEDSKSCNITIKTDIVAIGTARQAEKYGYKLTGYISNAESKQDDIGWRLFYQDDENTYIIANIPQGSYKPSDYYDASGETRYITGGKVSGVGKGLNSTYYEAYPTKFILGESSNMRAVAWMTDTTNSLWTQYKDSSGNAEWAIASPTIELLVASYNADAVNDGKTPLTVPEANSIGYKNSWDSKGILPQSYNHGIYNYSTSSKWWLASPGGDSAGECLCVYEEMRWNGDGSRVERKDVLGNSGMSYSVRPIVCIPTTTFNAAVTAGTYTLTDE